MLRTVHDKDGTVHQYDTRKVYAYKDEDGDYYFFKKEKPSRPLWSYLVTDAIGLISIAISLCVIHNANAVATRDSDGLIGLNNSNDGYYQSSDSDSSIDPPVYILNGTVMFGTPLTGGLWDET
jgi:hypothetical protein